MLFLNSLSLLSHCCYSTDLVAKQQVEVESECDEEHEVHDEELEERAQNPRDHDGINPEDWEVTEEQNQVHPSDEIGDDAELPLPRL